MNIPRFAACASAALLSLAVLAPAATQPDAPPPYQPTDSEKQAIRAKLDEMTEILKGVVTVKPSNLVLASRVKVVDPALLDDVLIFRKAGEFMLRYAEEEFFLPDHVKLTNQALDHGIARARQLAAGKADWATATGQLVRAYRSRVDGDLQPYALSIPASYDANANKPVRLDVILHGFSLTINEASFLASHDSGKSADPSQDFIRLEVFGRTNNSYRWGGEADVLEAVEAVRRHYHIDPDRIVLRGFSMGGAGAWAVGLHHPDRWAALEAGAGGAGSRNNFKPDNTPPHPGAVFRLHNMADWALNCANMPTVGYGGELDPQLAASVTIREQLGTEGYSFEAKGLNHYPAASSADLPVIFLVGPQTEHTWHPDSKKESEAFIRAACAKGRHAPPHIRFVTYSARYGSCFQFTIDGLERHYDRTELDARTGDDGRSQEVKTKNISRLLMEYPRAGLSLTLDGQPFPFKPTRVTANLPSVLFEKASGKWKSGFVRPADLAADKTVRKKPGIQGPIHDFMMDSFLVVRPTGQPNHPLAHEYAMESLDSFVKSYAKWMRADLRIKDDRAVTREDVAAHHLVLFGDPASNSILAVLAKELPIEWTRQSVKLGRDTYSAADHVPSLICANPRNPNRYVVVNAGHNTMKRGETRKLPVVSFQRLGDYAVLKLEKNGGSPGGDNSSGGGSIAGQVVTEGLFDEHWQLPGRNAFDR